MSQADPNVDLAIRERQLETHILCSHEYRELAGRRLKLLALGSVLTLLFVLGEGIFYLLQPGPASLLELGLIDITLLTLFTSAYLLLRTWRCLGRLNEHWLTPEAKKTLQALRLEKTKMHSGGI